MRRGRVSENHEGKEVLVAAGRMQEEWKMASHNICEVVRIDGLEAISQRKTRKDKK